MPIERDEWFDAEGNMDFEEVQEDLSFASDMIGMGQRHKANKQREEANKLKTKNNELLKEQSKLLRKQDEERRKIEALPECPYCGGKIPKRGVEICTHCNGKIGWVALKGHARVPCKLGTEEATRKKLEKAKEREKKKRIEDKTRKEKQRAKDKVERAEYRKWDQKLRRLEKDLSDSGKKERWTTLKNRLREKHAEFLDTELKNAESYVSKQIKNEKQSLITNLANLCRDSSNLCLSACVCFWIVVLLLMFFGWEQTPWPVSINAGIAIFTVISGIGTWILGKSKFQKELHGIREVSKRKFVALEQLEKKKFDEEISDKERRLAALKEDDPSP